MLWRAKHRKQAGVQGVERLIAYQIFSLALPMNIRGFFRSEFQVVGVCCCDYRWPVSGMWGLMEWDILYRIK